MERTRQLLCMLFGLLLLHCTSSTYFGDEFARESSEPARISWLFSNTSARAKRAVLRNDLDDDNLPRIISGKCRDKLNRLCGDIDRNNDELMLLECIQTFKVCINQTRKKICNCRRSCVNCRHKLYSLLRYPVLIKSVRKQFGSTYRILRTIKTSKGLPERRAANNSIVCNVRAPTKSTERICLV